MKQITLRLTGASDILIHSDRGANPLAPATVAHKKLTSKRKKTDEDHIAIAHSEYQLGFYDDAPGVRIPTKNVRSSIVGGAKLHKLGASFNRATSFADSEAVISHDGPDDHEDLWGSAHNVDCQSVKVGQARLMRYRPKLRNWSLEITLFYDETMLESDQILTAAKNAGLYLGLGDYRPEKGGTFGRYSVEEVG